MLAFADNGRESGFEPRAAPMLKEIEIAREDCAITVPRKREMERGTALKEFRMAATLKLPKGGDPKNALRGIWNCMSITKRAAPL